MTAPRHLTEAERHDAADGSLPPELRDGVTAHLAQCATCSADVARVKELMTRIQQVPAPVDDSGADLWPEILARIERDKIIQLSPSDAAPNTPRFAQPVFLAAAGLAAALLLLVALPQTRSRGKAFVSRAGSATIELQLATDSARAYEREATILLNELELRRAMMRPQTRASLDRDLRIVDNAILELREAIARDPNNPALRRLLASSYKQKIDLLKRVGG